MKFKDFGIRPSLDMDGNECKDLYELVKWQPYDSGTKRHCFVVAWLKWNPNEPCWELQSVGMRLMEYYESGLNKFIMKWAELAEVCMLEEDDE